jgi:hypothetical protein
MHDHTFKIAQLPLIITQSFITFEQYEHLFPCRKVGGQTKPVTSFHLLNVFIFQLLSKKELKLLTKPHTILLIKKIALLIKRKKDWSFLFQRKPNWVYSVFLLLVSFNMGALHSF